MRFGYCLNMVATGPDKTGMEHLETLAKLGFDYVELPCAESTALSEEDFEALLAKLKELKLPCETSNNFFPASIRLTGPDVDDAAVDAYVDRALDRLSRLGIEHIVFGSGGAKNVPEGFSMEEGYRQVVALLKRIAPKLRKRNIVLVIEPLRAVECNLINSFAEGVQLAKDVDDPNVRVLVDYYHLREMNEPAANVEKWGAEFLRHVHFARQEGRGCPADAAEDAHYKEFFAALKACGYDRRISCEAYSKDFEGDARAALNFFKNMTA